MIQAELLGVIPDLIFKIRRDGVYVDANLPASLSNTVPAGGIVGRHMNQLLPADKALLLETHVRKVLDTGEPQKVLYSLESDGEERFFEAHSHCADDDHVLTIVRDLTDHQAIEHALRRSEESLRTLINAIPDLLFTISCDGVYQSLHAPAERRSLLTAPGEEVAGKTLEELLPAPVAAEFRRALQEADQTRQTQFLEYDLPLQEAEPTWFEARIAPSVGGNCLVVVRDITARKHHERVIMAARQEAEEANRAKSAFLAKMSHELRTPLNAIIGFSELLTQHTCGAMTDKQGEYVGYVLSAGRHLLEVINDVLDFAKIESGRAELTEELFDLGETIAGVVRMQGGALEKGNLTLVEELPEPLPLLYADRRSVKQMLLNLLSNAIKFTPASGRITIGAKLDTAGLRLCVADTGIGIARAEHNRVLEPFRQSASVMTRSHDGTGLGLSIVKALIEAHGGTLDLDSEIGRGTRMTLLFPGERLVPTRPPRRRAFGT